MSNKDAITLLTHVRDHLNEPLDSASMLVPTAGQNFTQSFLLECLNKAKDRLVDLIRSNNENYFQTSGTLSLSPSTKEYALATDYQQLVGIKITTSGYEYMRLRYLDQSAKEFQWRDSLPSNNTGYLDELIYDIIGQSKIKFADFPPTTLTATYDYIQIVADYTLSAASTTVLPDNTADWLEAYTIYKALLKNAKDDRINVWATEIKRLTPEILKSTSKRNLRDSEYVEPY